MHHETGVAVGIGLKTGLLASMVAVLVSILAVVVGFTIVPLAPGHEIRDAARRLAAGLFSSFTLGPLLAIKVFDWWPGYLKPWHTVLDGQHPLWAHLAAATPFIAISGVLGFWIVAAVMRWFTNRAGKDIGEIAQDAKRDVIG